jgi:ketosteroid isomerase-like protein
MTTINDLDDFKALEPFFRIIEQGLDGLADGGHFFDLLAEDVVFDYIITTPGYPRHVEGRQAVAELFRPYGDVIVLDRCHDLAVHHDPNTGVVVLEYASQGRVVATGTPVVSQTGDRFLQVGLGGPGLGLAGRTLERPAGQRVGIKRRASQRRGSPSSSPPAWTPSARAMPSPRTPSRACGQP